MAKCFKSVIKLQQNEIGLKKINQNMELFIKTLIKHL